MKTIINSEQLAVLEALNGVLTSNLNEDALTKVLKATAGIDLTEADKLPKGVLFDYSGLTRKQQIIAKNTLVITVLPLTDQFLDRESADGQDHLTRWNGSPYIGQTDNAVIDFDAYNDDNAAGRGDARFVLVEVSSKIKSFGGETQRKQMIWQNFPIFDMIESNISDGILSFDIAGHFTEERRVLFTDRQGKEVKGREIRYGHDTLKDDNDKVIAEAVGETLEDMDLRLFNRNKRNSNTPKIVINANDDKDSKDSKDQSHVDDFIITKPKK